MTDHQPPKSLLHLHPLPPTSLPSHPILSPHQPTPSSLPPLSVFAANALSEATTLIDKTLPSTFTSTTKSKPSPPSTAPVELLSRSIPASSLPEGVKGAGDSSSKGEAWFARRSRHEDKKEKGTATWEEFEDGLLREHSKHEGEYTPDVYDAVEVVRWGSEEIGVVEGFEGVGVCVYEMAHHIPPPLSNRVFSVVVVTAHTPNPTSEGLPAFIVVQIPVDISMVKEAMYSNGRHKTEGDTAEKKKPVTVGQYTSVERVKAVKGKEEGGLNEIVWEMATASDARGSLPMAIQKMSVPGAIAKDVGYLLGWVAQRRSSAA
ncbi:MAG: hypothetical protein M1820_006722 [Bogoriella megaspora]|nr:MAG: hypothetical protein M1820_006722 [Bogoriella megaspora]